MTQKQKRKVDVDSILNNAKKLKESEYRKVSEYLDSIRYAENKPPKAVILTQLKRAVGGDEEKLKMLFKAPEDGFKGKEIKTEQITATQQFQSLRDMLKLSEDAPVRSVVEAFAEKAGCSLEEAENLISNLRSSEKALDAYKTAMTIMSSRKQEEPQEAHLDLDTPFNETAQHRKIIDVKGDNTPDTAQTGKMAAPDPDEEPTKEIEEIPLPDEDQRPTSVMPAPKIDEPLAKNIPLRSVEDEAQMAEPPGKTTQMESPVPEKLPEGVAPMLKPTDLEQPAEPPGKTQTLKAVGGNAEWLLKIAGDAEKVKDLLLIKGTKLSHVYERLKIEDKAVEEGLKLYASELISRGLSKEEVKKKLLKKGVDQLDADATLVVMDDEGIMRVSGISYPPRPLSESQVLSDEPIPTSEVKVVVGDTETKVPKPAPDEEKRERTEELEAIDVEEIEAEEKKKAEEEQDKEHGDIATADTRLSAVPDISEEMLKDAVHSADEKEDSGIRELDGIDIDFDEKGKPKPLSAPSTKAPTKPPKAPGSKRISHPVPALGRTQPSGQTPAPMRRLKTPSEVTTQYQLDTYWAPEIANQIGQGLKVDVILGYMLAKGIEPKDFGTKLRDGAIYYTIVSLQAGKKKKEIIASLKKCGFNRSQSKDIYNSPQVTEEIRRLKTNGAPKIAQPIPVKLSKHARKAAEHGRKLMLKNGLSKELVRQRLEAVYSPGIVNDAMNSDIINKPYEKSGVGARLAKWAAIIGIPAIVLGGAGAALHYTGMLEKLLNRDKQEQVQEKKTDKKTETQEPAKDVKLPVEEQTDLMEIFMSEVPVKSEGHVEEKSEPVKLDEPLVETQPSEEPKEKVLDNGKTVEKPLDKPAKKKTKKGATDDLDKIFGGF